MILHYFAIACFSDLPHTPTDTGEIPAMSECDDRQEMAKSTSALSQSHGMVLSENMEKPFNGGSLERCNGITEQETVLPDNHTSGAATQAILLCNNFDQQSLPFEGGRAESDALFPSKCEVTEDCAISDKSLQNGMQNIMDANGSVDRDVCLTTEQSCNQAAKAELETTFTGIAADKENSAEIVNISSKSTGNEEKNVSQLRPDAITPDNEEAVMADESCLDGNYYNAWSNCQAKDKEMDAFDESMRLNSLLQIKLLFRSDSYETLERLVDGETEILLGKALDEVFTVRRNREKTLRSPGRKGWGNFHRDEIKTENGMLHYDELSSVGHQDPFNPSKSNVFQVS